VSRLTSAPTERRGYSFRSANISDGVKMATQRIKKSSDIRIGISGWNYKPWRGVFYPSGLPHRRELEFASRQLNSIEINGSFYSLQRPSSYRRWHEESPDGFIFAVKGGRFITHMKRLRDIEIPLANFFASGILCLREKLGPILWQFPPQFRWNEERFRKFFELLPCDSSSAAKLAKRHNEKVKGRAWTKMDRSRSLRYAIEIRHDSFLVPEFFSLLRKYNMAFVVSDAAAKWPYAEDLTANFVYCRLHGAEELYASGYSDSAIEEWANRVRKWRIGKHPRDACLITPRAEARPGHRDVFVYFDNDAKVHAPFDAKKLAKRLGLN
jgi:uncharacterized protein YecE (DUF72 family)